MAEIETSAAVVQLDGVVDANTEVLSDPGGHPRRYAAHSCEHALPRVKDAPCLPIRVFAFLLTDFSQQVLHPKKLAASLLRNMPRMSKSPRKFQLDCIS